MKGTQIRKDGMIQELQQEIAALKDKASSSSCCLLSPSPLLSYRLSPPLSSPPLLPSPLALSSCPPLLSSPAPFRNVSPGDSARFAHRVLASERGALATSCGYGAAVTHLPSVITSDAIGAGWDLSSQAEERIYWRGPAIEEAAERAEVTRRTCCLLPPQLLFQDASAADENFAADRRSRRDPRSVATCTRCTNRHVKIQTDRKIVKERQRMIDS